MAVANATTELIIPGLDSLVQSNLNYALTNNLTIQAIQTNLNNTGSFTTLSNNISGLSTDLDNLPTREPLPTFATFSNFNNNPWWSIWNSDMKYISAGNQHTDSELWSPWTGVNYTNGNIGSNSWTSYWMGATPMFQADGHMYLRLNEGYGTYTASNPDNLDYVISRCGVVIGAYGVRQKFSLFLDGSTIQVRERGIGNDGYYESLNLNQTQYSTWFGGTSYGMIGYNDRTRTLVAIEAKDGSNNYRLHRWINTGTNRSLNARSYVTGTLHLFLSEAKTGLTSGGSASYNFYDFQWQASSSQNYNESRYRMRIIPGDNGIIGMARMVPSNTTHYATYTPTSQTLTTNFNTIGLTTSYGIDQGNKYGIRHQITWDNYWVAAYSCYYYYGSGMNTFFIDSRDPRNYFIAQYGSTDNGCSLVPFQRNKFMWTYHVSNADGDIGMRLSIIDLEGAKNGRVTSGTISNGGTITMQNNTQYGLFDTKYTSTNYPILLSMPHWRVHQ